MEVVVQKNQEIKPGTVILSEKPFVYALSSKYRTEHCDFCFQKYVSYFGFYYVITNTCLILEVICLNVQNAATCIIVIRYAKRKDGPRTSSSAII